MLFVKSSLSSYNGLNAKVILAKKKVIIFSFLKDILGNNNELK